MARRRINPIPKCVECGETIPYGGKGRPRKRHVGCMTPEQRIQRTYMKAYMPKYYERPGNREKHNKSCAEYIQRKRDRGYEG